MTLEEIFENLPEEDRDFILAEAEAGQKPVSEVLADLLRQAIADHRAGGGQ